ncbi:hypothetical protein EJB05_01469, partial [Eragrostis curvula]
KAVWGALQWPDQRIGRDAAAPSVVTIHRKMAQLRRQIQSGRLTYIKKLRVWSDQLRSSWWIFYLFLLQEMVEANWKVLLRHACTLFDVAAAVEGESRGREGNDALSQRAVEACTVEARGVGPGQKRAVRKGGGVRAGGNFSAGTLILSSTNCAAHKTMMWFVKLPLVERIPPCTTWIFLDK